MSRYKTHYRRHRQPEAEKPPADKKRKLFLLVPPLVGAAVAYNQHQQMKAKADELRGSIQRERQEFTNSYLRQSVSVARDMMQDTQFSQAVADLRAGKSIDYQRLRELDARILQERPEYVTDLATTMLTSAFTIRRLQTQLQQTERDTTPSTAKAFAIGTGLPYLAMALFVVYNGLRARLASRMREARAEKTAEPEERPSEPPRLRSKPPIALLPAPKDEKPAAPEPVVEFLPVRRPEKSRARAEASETPAKGLPALDAFAAPGRQDGNGKKRSMESTIFSEESSAELTPKGFDPKVVEKALIRAFKILSKNSILVGMRYGQAPDVKRDIKRAVGDDYRAAMLLALLEEEGMLIRHKGGDCLSLNPHPEGDLGKLMVRDITANLVRMGKTRVSA
ncbi:MAG: hypothetical protein AB1529_05380 [Candidatus Micrarchaeota archaeon]